jgi:hypothetical protein
MNKISISVAQIANAAVAVIGIDLAKHVFAIHGVNRSGKPVLVKPTVRREQLLELLAQLPPCLMLKRRIELSAPHGGEIAGNMLRGMPKSTMMLAAGALMAGTYLMKRNSNQHRNNG